VATAVIDGITTRYEVIGSGPALLMFSPGGFDATLDKWTTQSIYKRIKPVDHLSTKYTCIIFAVMVEIKRPAHACCARTAPPQ
jgi:hypothetical protein